MGQVQTDETRTAVSHATSLAVWGVPAPLILGTTARIKVGAKCAGGCSLAGAEVEIYDHAGVKVATGLLGSEPYTDTVDLYWAEVELPAPAAKGAYVWEARLIQPGSDHPHEAAAFKFSFTAAQAAAYAITIEAVDETTKAPVAQARVMLRPYSGYTDDQGVVKLVAAGGDYTLFITKGEYETYRADVTVTGDATVRAELTPAEFREDYRGNVWKVEKRRWR